MNEYKLIDASLVEDDDGRHYLDLTYEYEDQYRISKVHFPMVRLPIERVRYINSSCGNWDHEHSVEFGNGLELLLSKYKDIDGNEYVYKAEVIKEKAQKMTIAEIEKKLGYKIEIVSEK